MVKWEIIVNRNKHDMVLLCALNFDHGYFDTDNRYICAELKFRQGHVIFSTIWMVTDLVIYFLLPIEFHVKQL